jgi:amino acid permease
MKKVFVEISIALILVLIITYVLRLIFGVNYPFGSLWPDIISDWRTWFIILSVIILSNAIQNTINTYKRDSSKYFLIRLLLIFLVFTIVMTIFVFLFKATSREKNIPDKFKGDMNAMMKREVVILCGNNIGHERAW